MVSASYWGETEMFRNYRETSCTSLQMYPMLLNCHFKRVNFMLHKFYLSKLFFKKKI